MLCNSIHHLLPLTWDETRQFSTSPASLEELLYTGSYLGIYSQRPDPSEWLSAYVHNYLERDIRSLSNIGDLIAFQSFVELCAGRSGTLLNYSSIANDCGVSQPTVTHWVSLLEASFIAFRLPAFHRNLRKRVVKMPKIYFYDTGLVCWLLGIRTPEQIRLHPLRGQIFETWVVSELVKHRTNSSETRGLYFYRDHNGVEVDMVIPESDNITLVEVKSAKTPSTSLVGGMKRISNQFSQLLQPVETAVVYGGESFKRLEAGKLLPWRYMRSLGIEKEAMISVSNDFRWNSQVQVSVVLPNGTSVFVSPDETGVVRFNPDSLYLPIKVYAAAVGYCAYLETRWIPAERILHITPQLAPNGGSVIISQINAHIPGLEGQFDVELDAAGHALLSSSAISVNGNHAPSVRFELGQELKLTDAHENRISVRIVDMAHRMMLLQYAVAIDSGET